MKQLNCLEQSHVYEHLGTGVQWLSKKWNQLLKQLS